MAAHQGQFDRGRHQRDPARHHRQAHPRTSGSLIAMPLYLTDDQAMLRDTARELHGRGRRDREAAAPLARHRLQGRLRPRSVEAVRRAGLHRHPDRRGRWRARPRPCRGRDRARGDRPQPDALALPDQRRRLRRGAEGHGARARAGIPASSPARRSRRWRSTKAPKHRPEAIAMRAERSGNGFSLSGRKQFVVQGASADVTLVAAQTDEGLTLFAVEKGAERPRRRERAPGRFQHRRAADLRQCRGRRRCGGRRGRRRRGGAVARARRRPRRRRGRAGRRRRARRWT